MALSEMYRTLKTLYQAEGQRVYCLAVYGDCLAKEMRYKEHTDMDAIHYYLVDKYKWTLAQVKSMSYEDILFVLAEKMSGWVLPKDAIEE